MSQQFAHVCAYMQMPGGFKWTDSTRATRAAQNHNFTKLCNSFESLPLDTVPSHNPPREALHQHSAATHQEARPDDDTRGGARHGPQLRRPPLLLVVQRAPGAGDEELALDEGPGQG